MVAGGVDAPFNKYAWTVNPEGVLELQPSQDYAQAYEDKWLLEWIPWVNAFLKENYHVMRGKPLNLLNRLHGGQLRSKITDEPLGLLNRLHGGQP